MNQLNSSTIHTEREGSRIANYPGRRWVLGAGAGLLAMVSIFGVASWNKDAGHDYTQEQLSDMPSEPIVVGQGQGANEVIAEVDSNLGPQTAADVTKFILDQGKDGVLQNGQHVNVPEIPGHTKSQSGN